MKQLAILGSTGSIGCNAVAVVQSLPERYAIRALSAGRNTGLLAEQIRRHHPDIVAVLDEESAAALASLLPRTEKTEILWGPEGYCRAAAYGPVDMVVSAMVGSAGLLPTLSAIDAGKQVALANKEALVMAGHIVIERTKAKGVNILPIDSEHSAIFQCLAGHQRGDLDKIFLTASGGPFLNLPAREFAGIQPRDALNHPTWRMGEKITIDSATLMNKGLEVLEAIHLFQVSQKSIEILIHPQSVVHSMVSFRDGAMLAQLGVPDMKGAIAYAMSYPERYPIGQPLPDLPKMGPLTFEFPDYERFPCLSLAFQAADAGGTMPAVLNAANEVAVDAFLGRRLSFGGISEMIHRAMDSHPVVSMPALENVLEADRWAREETATYIARAER